MYTNHYGLVSSGKSDETPEYVKNVSAYFLRFWHIMNEKNMSWFRSQANKFDPEKHYFKE